MKSVRHLSAVAAFSLFFQPGFAQKLVDPNTVAPEFRAAAEKRRAEQINLNECVKKANDAKVPKRDRAGFISGCAESHNQTPSSNLARCFELRCRSRSQFYRPRSRAGLIDTTPPATCPGGARLGVAAFAGGRRPR